MKVVFISDNGQHHKRITINLVMHILLPSLLLVAGLVSMSLYVYKYSSGISHSSNGQKNRSDFVQVLPKLMRLDAEVQRLNALSVHIATRINVDIQTFDLSNVPAQGGGISGGYPTESISQNQNIENNIIDIENKLVLQKLKLKNILASLEIRDAQNYLDRLVQSKATTLKASKDKMSHDASVVYDFSIPLKKGYISSKFGKRRDPINGKLRHHSGLDIAANKGTNIYAIANGFVTFSGKRGAYGNMLEINHSESLKSRYAHLDSYLVKKGQLVKKGDVIGKVGDTGRVTGPHLHLEIRENNKIVDPQIFLKEAMKTL